jgi:N-acetylglucosaminyldiphosphoundecaprenol N-acetyl-beta-D-mannosaminyltransferase
VKVRLGQLLIDSVGFDEALQRIEQLVDARRGGMVFTPNVDHVVVAERDAALRDAYTRASLVVADGQPIVWTSALLGHRLPAKVSGSDLFLPLMRRAAERKSRVYLLGAGPGVGEEAARRLSSELGVVVCGTDAPRVGMSPEPDEDLVVERVRAARPDLLLVCLGAPKAELFLDRIRERVAPAVGLCFGGTLDFYVGRVRRAPRWMQRAGLEWLFRLAQEPRRLARRYLINDPAFLLVLARTLRLPRSERVLEDQGASALRSGRAGAPD